jgi:hypothetical protein
MSFWPKLRLFRRCTIWCPTWLGLFSITILTLLPVTWWFLCGESFLSLTRRMPPQILVVEGWIGFEAIHGAKVEFDQQGYQYVVTTGGLTSSVGWQKGGWVYRRKESLSRLLRIRKVNVPTNLPSPSGVRFNRRASNPRRSMFSRWGLTPGEAFWFFPKLVSQKRKWA